MQFVVSGPLGNVIERYGFMPVCMTFSVLPILSYFLVNFLIPDDAKA